MNFYVIYIYSNLASDKRKNHDYEPGSYFFEVAIFGGMGLSMSLPNQSQSI